MSGWIRRTILRRKGFEEAEQNRTAWVRSIETLREVRGNDALAERFSELTDRVSSLVDRIADEASRLESLPPPSKEYREPSQP